MTFKVTLTTGTGAFHHQELRQVAVIRPSRIGGGNGFHLGTIGGPTQQGDEKTKLVFVVFFFFLFLLL